MAAPSRLSLRETIKSDAVLLFKALIDKHTPLFPRLLIILLIVYVISPVDILPDWILFLGIVDDLIVISLLTKKKKKLLPKKLKDEFSGKVIEWEVIREHTSKN